MGGSNSAGKGLKLVPALNANGERKLAEPQRDWTGDLQREQVDGLVAAAGVDGAREILNAFRRSTTELLGSLSAQVKRNAFDLAADTAHAVKGSAANIGAQRLSETAAYFEDACKRSDAAGVADALNDMNQQFVAACNAFEEHLSRA